MPGLLDPEEKKKYFAEHPDEYLEYCKNLETEVSEVFKSIQVGSPEAERAKVVSSAQYSVASYVQCKSAGEKGNVVPRT